MTIFVDALKQCKDHLKSSYLNRPKEFNKWSKLGGISLHIEVTILKAKYLAPGFLEEHSMGLIRHRNDYFTVEEILSSGYGKIILIEGDPGAGKTTLTFNICKQWANGKLWVNEMLFWVPLRHYQNVTNFIELFDKFNCSQMKEYAQQNNGKGLVFILDGWDELPDHIQSQSFFHDIIFKKSALTCSTIIVTSRPSCSDHIAEVVQDHYYQILGFTLEKAFIYIRNYFDDDLQSAKSLLDFLKDRKHLHRHFYIPITVVIMCFVYCKGRNQLPETLSKLYEWFVLLCVRANIPNSQRPNFTTIQNVPETLRPLFRKLCKVALDMLKLGRLEFRERELKISQEDLELFDPRYFENFDGFGLLHIEHVTNDLADKEKCYSFIHRAVQELLAAISILESKSVKEMIDQYFHEDSYLINVFPFLFGLMPKMLLESLADKLIQILFQSGFNRKLLSAILHCLFEAQDDDLCCKVSLAFSEFKSINMQLNTHLEYRYAFYFLSVCRWHKMNLNLLSLFVLTDVDVEVMAKYFCRSLTDIAFLVLAIQLSQKGIKCLSKLLSHQENLVSLSLYSFALHSRGCVKILCDSVHQYCTQLTKLRLPCAELSEEDLESLSCLLAVSKSLNILQLHGCVLVEEASLSCFCDALCQTMSLTSLSFSSCSLSQVDCETLAQVLSQKICLRDLNMLEIPNDKCLNPILSGLTSNTTLKLFRVSPRSLQSYHSVGHWLKKCFMSNQSLTTVDFTGYPASLDRYILWSSSQVCSICTGLQSNNTLVTLDVTGCYIDKTASDAVCVMLSLNTSLQHLFLNPIHMEKPEAIAIINSCNINTKLMVLSLVKSMKSKFPFATDQEVNNGLTLVQNYRQSRKMPSLNVIW